MTNEPLQLDLGGDVADLPDDEPALTIELPTSDAPDVIVALLAAELLAQDAGRPDFEDTVEQSRRRVEEQLLDADDVDEAVHESVGDRIVSLIRLHSNDLDLAAALHLELGADEYHEMRRREMLADMDTGEIMGMLMGPGGPQPVDPAEMPDDVRAWLVEHAPRGPVEPDDIPEFVADWFDDIIPADPDDGTGGDPTFQ